MFGGAWRTSNLLLILAGLIFGALLMQWRWSRKSAECVGIRRRFPREAFAGKPFRVRYRFTNVSRLIAIWTLRAEDEIASLSGNAKSVAISGVGRLNPEQTLITYCDCLFTKRGRYQFGPIGLMTTFPFSLFSSRQYSAETEELHVFPSLLQLRSRWQTRLASRSGGESTTARQSGSVEGDFFGLREWQTGDSRKWIHWRTTARLGEPAVRQFEQQRRFDTCILVDAFCGDQETDENVELAISLAATFLTHLSSSPSNRMVLACAGTESSAVIGGGSTAGKRRMLELLAELGHSPAPDLEAAIAKSTQIVGRGQDLLVISPRSLEEASGQDECLPSLFAPWLRTGSFRWIDVSSRELERWAAPPRQESVKPAEQIMQNENTTGAQRSTESFATTVPPTLASAVPPSEERRVTASDSIERGDS
ncbi:MAG: hypothetical protein CMM07_23970 [Rhodopirellula sp.]|nr:hypothetical protein [Rhodopirellula sp.]